MFKVEILSHLTPGKWVNCHLGEFTTKKLAQKAAENEFGDRRAWRVVNA